MLNDFFAPHNLSNLFIFFLFLFFWDVSGWGISTQIFRLRPPDWLRPVLWCLGFGLQVLFLFFWHLIWPFRPWVILASGLGAGLPFFRRYRKSQFPVWKRTFTRLSLPLLMIVGLLPWIWIKTSLPPYLWDEMSYHYISPYKLATELHWQFDGLYSNLPRLLDTGFILLFTVTQTYASARLLHLTIYLSVLAGIYLFLLPELPIAAITGFALLTFGQMPLLTAATTGYVDAAAAGFIIITWLLLPSNPGLAAVFAGLSVGTKYNAVLPVTLAAIAGLGFLIKNRTFKWRLLLQIPVLFLIFGGYWYLKNLWLYGNPVYPLGFTSSRQLFSSWTIPFDWPHLSLILTRLLWNSRVGAAAAGLVVFSGFFLLPVRRRWWLLAGIGFWLLDLFFNHYFTGFELRYFFHWVIIFMLGLSISLAAWLSRISSRYPGLLKVIIPLALIGSAYLTYQYRLFIPGRPDYPELAYAVGRFSLSDWIRRVLPVTSGVIFWCNELPRPVSLTVADPDLLWSTAESLFPIFLTRCSVDGVKLPGQSVTYFLSGTSCPDPGEKLSRRDGESEMLYNMRVFNHRQICASRSLLPALFQYSNESP